MSVRIRHRHNIGTAFRYSPSHGYDVRSVYSLVLKGGRGDPLHGSKLMNALSYAAHYYNSLEYLSVRHTNEWRSGEPVDVLCQLIEKNKGTLRELDLRHNGMTDQDLKEVVEAIGPGLQKLCLSGNRFGDEAGQILKRLRDRMDCTFVIVL